MNWKLLVLVPALLLAACTGRVESQRFKEAKEFFDYMDGLKLNKMSMSAASARLAAEGYICSISGMATICSASESTLMCKDKTSVTLTPKDKHQILVKEKYSALCI